MSKGRFRWTRRNSIVTAAIVTSGALAGTKVYQYSADPVGEKNCAPLVAQTPAGSETTSFAPTVVDPIEANYVSTLPWSQKGGMINDASCLNQTSVYGIVKVTNEDDIKRALAFAQEKGLKVSIAGVRHSMGGHAFFRNALVLDMTSFNRMELDERNKVLSVQSGATWHAIQDMLHPKYAVKAMQSTDIFTVGGSISVNAHGMDHQAGSIGQTVRSMRVMLPDGSIQQVSRTENPELFHLVIGGYGLFGIVLDAKLDIADNVIYSSGRQIIDYTAFPDLFNSELVKDQRIGLMYGHLSTAPQSLLQEMIVYTYTDAEIADANVPPLAEVSQIKLRRFVINFSKHGSLPMRLKWFSEKYIEPRIESCTVTRNQAMKDGEACLVSRNEPMHDSVSYLKNNLKDDTDILQEYFIPRDQFVSFVDGLRQIVRDNNTNLLNASVRVVHREENMLNYAPGDMFAVVLYVNQSTSAEDNQRMAETTRQIIDLTIRHKGTFFLPYQLYYTPEQLHQAYPMIDDFFAAKQRYDPQSILTNTFYERYGKQPNS